MSIRVPFPAVAKGTSCTQSSFKAGKGTFLFIGPGPKGKGFKAMFRLKRSLPQANRLAAGDPDRFEDPDRFDIRRKVGSHLAFGRGAHHCLGNMLARMEAQIAINSLLQRMPRLELATDTVEWQEYTSFRSLKSLPVTFSI